MSDKSQRSQSKSENGRDINNNQNTSSSTNNSTGAVNNASNNGNGGKFPVMLPNSNGNGGVSNSNTIIPNNARNMPPSSAIIPSMSIDPNTLAATNGNNNMMRMNSVGSHSYQHSNGASVVIRGQHPQNYMINQPPAHQVGFNNRSDNRYSADPQTKNNSMNRPQYYRSNLMPNIPPHQGFNNYGFYNNKRKRRERTSFTKNQLTVLLETYALQPYPDVQQRLDIAARIGLDESRVQVWFKNRRAKERKDELVASSIRANTSSNNVITSTTSNQTSSTANQNVTHSNVGGNNAMNQHQSVLPSTQHPSSSQQTRSQSSQPSTSQGMDHNSVHHQYNNHQQQIHHMHHSLNPHDQFLQQNTQGNRYPTNMHLPNPTPFVELFGVSAFGDENDVMNQYSDLMPNNQQDNGVNAFTMNPSAIGITKEEAELLISSSPNLPKLQPLKQNFNEAPSKQN